MSCAHRDVWSQRKDKMSNMALQLLGANASLSSIPPTKAVELTSSFTPVAAQRDPNVEQWLRKLGLIVQETATQYRLALRELVVRADWSEEKDEADHTGLVADVYVKDGESETRFAFWDALAERVNNSKLSNIQLSVMLHAG